MKSIKLLFIALLGLFVFGYNLLNNNLLGLLYKTDIIVLLQGQIIVDGHDSYFGIIIDFIISFLFNVNIKDFASLFKLFGG